MAKANKHRVSVRIDAGQWKALVRLAEKRERTPSGELRMAIREYLEAKQPVGK